MQFLHQMLNVSAVLLDDALFKWVVVTEVVLFSVVAFKTHFKCSPDSGSEIKFENLAIWRI